MRMRIPSNVVLCISIYSGSMLAAFCAVAEEGPAPETDWHREQAQTIGELAEAASTRLRQKLTPPRKLPRLVALQLRAGVAEIDITPQQSMRLDGYWSDRPSTGVHAPLKVKALVLDDGRTRTALVISDLITYYFEWGEVAKRKQSVVPPENVVLCTTHTHAAPLMTGIFGPIYMDYVVWTGERMAEAITKAADNLQPARIGFAASSLPEEDGKLTGVAQNWHNPGVLDPALLVMRVESAEGAPIATLVNFGNHPDVLGNATTLISPDFFWYVYEGVTDALGGATLVFNRALGGVEPIGQGANDIAEAEEIMQRIGGIVTESVVKAADSIHWVDKPRISVRRTQCEFPVLSPDILKAFGAGLLPFSPQEGLHSNEMALIEIGPAQILTVPGEPHPEVVSKLVDMMKPAFPFVFSQAEDGIGYVVPEELFNPEGIQELLSTGRDNEFVVLSAARRLLGIDGYIEPEAIAGKPSKVADAPLQQE